MPASVSAGPRMPCGPNAASSPMPAAAGGRISGSSISVRHHARPRKSRVASRYAAGVPTATITAHGDAAWSGGSARARRPRPGRRGWPSSSPRPDVDEDRGDGQGEEAQRERGGAPRAAPEERPARAPAHRGGSKPARRSACCAVAARAGPRRTPRCLAVVIGALHDRDSVDHVRLQPRGQLDRLAAARPRPARPSRRRSPASTAPCETLPTTPETSGSLERMLRSIARACSRAQPRQHLAGVGADRHARRPGRDPHSGVVEVAERPDARRRPPARRSRGGWPRT